MSLFDKDTERARSEHKRVTRTAGMLTEKRGLGEYELKICMSCGPDEENMGCGSCIHFQAAIERLGEYEATGLTPKEGARFAKKVRKASTWYEKIQRMTVKELAEFIEGLDSEYPACSKEFCEAYQESGFCNAHKTGGCIKATENWLNSKIEEE